MPVKFPVTFISPPTTFNFVVGVIVPMPTFPPCKFRTVKLLESPKCKSPTSATRIEANEILVNGFVVNRSIDLSNRFLQTEIFTHINNNITSNNASVNAYGWLRNNTDIKINSLNVTINISMKTNNSIFLAPANDRRIYANDTCVIIKAPTSELVIC